MLDFLLRIVNPFMLWNDIALLFVKLLSFIPPPMMVLVAFALLILVVRLIPL